MHCSKLQSICVPFRTTVIKITRVTKLKCQHVHAQHGHLKSVLCLLSSKKNMLNSNKSQNEILMYEYVITTLIHRAAAELFCFKSVKTNTTQNEHTKYCELAGLFVLGTHCVVT